MNNRSLVIVMANAKAKPARAASMNEKTEMKATQLITRVERTLKREDIHRFTVELCVIISPSETRGTALTSPHPVVRVRVLVG